MEDLSTGRLIGEIARRTGRPKAEVKLVVESLIEAARDHLLAGGRVELRGLASFSVLDRRPRMGRDPKTQKTIFIPVGRRIRTRVAPTLRKRLSKEFVPEGAVVAAEDDPEAEAFAERIREAGCRVRLGGSINEALGVGRRSRKTPDFIVLAASVDEPSYDSMARTLKFDEATSMIPMVRWTSRPQELKRPKSVKILPEAHFTSPDEGEAIVQAEAERWHEERQYFRRQIALRSRSDPASIEALSVYIDELAGRALKDETEAYKTLSAFREAVDNAARHGNGSSPEKYVTAVLIEDTERILFEVKDQGKGFGHDEFTELAAAGSHEVVKERLGRGEAGGLGVKLMVECTDEFSYSEGGSRLRMLKWKRGAGR